MNSNKTEIPDFWVDLDFIDLVKPFYDGKDLMHNFDHVNRLKFKVSELSPNNTINDSRMFYGIFSHGIMEDNEQIISDYLHNKGMSRKEIELIKRIALINKGSIEPKSIEEKIAHDAHYLEGGQYFWILKSLITGSLKGQSLEETIRYFEQKLLIEKVCVLPESETKWEDRLKISHSMINDLKSNF